MAFKRNLILVLVLLFVFSCAAPKPELTDTPAATQGETPAAAPAETPAATPAAAGSNVTGTWIMDVQLQAGTGNPTFKLTQEGETITGTYAGQMGEAPVTGTIKGKDFELIIKSSGMGEEMTVTYKGALQEDGTMKGTVNMGEQFGDGTFTGKKQ